MAEFVCDLCGKCCRSFGEFIRIERQMTERDYYCRYGITNDLFLVHVLPEYAEEISEAYLDSTPGSGNAEKKCAFLLKNPEGNGFVCAVYPTRPPVCREFRCYRMLIRNQSGNLVGRVIGKNEIRTRDEALAMIWKEHISPLRHSYRPNENDPGWTAQILAILTRYGYHGEPVE
jgi:Fe-S-cluster containining protein